MRERCIYLFMYLFILHVVSDRSSDFTVIFKVYQDRLCQKASLLISVPSSSSRLRNPSIAERGESFVWCIVIHSVASRFMCCGHSSLQ